MKNLNSKFVYIFPIVLVSILWIFRLTFWTKYLAWFGEDNVVEYAQFVFYFISCWILFVSAYLSLKSKKYGQTAIYFVMFLIVFVISMEEISWGQRIFGISTPESLEEENVQGELNFHNLGFFHNNFLHIAFMLVGFGASVGSWLVGKTRIPKFWKEFLPPRIVFFYFFIPALFYFYLEFMLPIEAELRNGGIFINGDQELFELVLSVGVLLYSLLQLASVRMRK